MESMKNFIKLFFILSSVYSYDILVGSYSKLQTLPTDKAIFNACLTLSKSIMTNDFGDSVESSFVNLATYSQVVNGINYKFLNAYKDKISNSYKLSDTVVYTGPFSSFLTNPNPTVSSNQILTPEILNKASNDVKTNRIITNLNCVITTYLKANLKDSTLISLNDIQTFNHYTSDENYYIAGATLSTNSTVKKDYFFIVNELKEVFSIVTNLTN